jgi:ACR3 family arsenite transporter
LSLLTKRWSKRNRKGERWANAMGWLPVPFMTLTLLLVVASQLPKIGDSLGRIIGVITVYAAFLAVMALVGLLMAFAGLLAYVWLVSAWLLPGEAA